MIEAAVKSATNIDTNMAIIEELEPDFDFDPSTMTLLNCRSLRADFRGIKRH